MHSVEIQIFQRFIAPASRFMKALCFFLEKISYFNVYHYQLGNMYIKPLECNYKRLRCAISSTSKEKLIKINENKQSTNAYFQAQTYICRTLQVTCNIFHIFRLHLHINNSQRTMNSDNKSFLQSGKTNQNLFTLC